MKKIIFYKNEYFFLFFVSLSAYFIPYIEFINHNKEALEPFLFKTLSFILILSLLFGLIFIGFLVNTGFAFMNDWNPQSPSILFLPNLQDWIFNVPTTAGARAMMIGIALGIVGTSFRIITGLERSFLGE